MIKFSTEIPVIYHKCHEKFGVNWSKGIAITYGDTVYSKYTLHPSVEVHEAVHVKQQALIGPELWWQQYLEDPAFRFKQELPAYRAQVRWLRKYFNRNQGWAFIDKLCHDLSGEMYGNLCTLSEARRLLN